MPVDELAAKRLANTGERARMIFDVFTTGDLEMAMVCAY
jgi:hypothetical protein